MCPVEEATANVWEMSSTTHSSAPLPSLQNPTERTIPECDRVDLSAALSLQPNLAQDLAEPHIEEHALTVCESYSENVDGGRLGESGDGGGGGEEGGGFEGVDEGTARGRQLDPTGTNGGETDPVRTFHTATAPSRLPTTTLLR